MVPFSIVGEREGIAIFSCLGKEKENTILLKRD
jgi:hypothetical protein